MGKACDYRWSGGSRTLMFRSVVLIFKPYHLNCFMGHAIYPILQISSHFISYPSRLPGNPPVTGQLQTMYSCTVTIPVMELPHSYLHLKYCHQRQSGS